MNVTKVQSNSFTGRVSPDITRILKNNVKNQAEMSEILKLINNAEKMTHKDTFFVMDNVGTATPRFLLENKKFGISSFNYAYNPKEALKKAFIELSESQMFITFIKRNRTLEKLPEIAKEFPKHEMKLNGKTLKQFIQENVY